jgi:hypothetical protein
MNLNCKLLLFLFILIYQGLLISKNEIFNLYDYNEILDVNKVILDSNNIIIYDKLQNDIIKYNLTTKEITFLKIEQLIANHIKKENITFSMINSIKMLNDIPYCVYTVRYTEDSLYYYNCFIVNLITNKIDLLTDNRNYIIYGLDFEIICDSIFIFQTYTSNYHHSQHKKQKDSVSFISFYSDNKLKKLFSIADLEKYTTSELAYVFELKLYEFNNNLIILIKQLDLFIAVSFDCSNFQNNKISRIERNKFLTEFFEQSKVNEPFKAYDKYIHQKNNKFEFLDIFEKSNFMYLVFYEKNENIYNLTIIKYDSQFTIVSTKNIEIQTTIKNSNSVIKLENNLSEDLILIKNQNDDIQIIELNLDLI